MKAQEDIFANLPPLLMTQLQIALKRRLVAAVPMFKDVSSRSAVALVRRLNSFVVIPDGACSSMLACALGYYFCGYCFECLCLSALVN